MKVLILYRHFWPDSPPYASMLRSIGRRLAEEGHDVSIWTEQPCYKSNDAESLATPIETLDGMEIQRLSLLPGWKASSFIRMLDKLIFPIRILIKALYVKIKGKHYDLVWTATIPPVAQGMAGRWIANLFGAQFLYHCQDVYPELGVHSGLWSKGGPINRLLTIIEKRTRKRADWIVTLSKDMAKTIIASAKPKQPIKVINNFLLEDFSDTDIDLPSETTANFADRDNIQLIFAGNIGQFQGLENLVEAMRIVHPSAPNLEMLFLGEGKSLKALKQLAQGLECIKFMGHRQFAEAQKIMALADIGIVSLQQRLYRFAYPSKALTYWGLSLPVLAIIEGKSELAKTNLEDAGGWSVAGDDPSIIAERLRVLARLKPDEIQRRKAIVETWYQHNLSRSQMLDQWANLLEVIEDERSLK